MLDCCTIKIIKHVATRINIKTCLTFSDEPIFKILINFEYGSELWSLMILDQMIEKQFLQATTKATILKQLEVHK